jgi:hypothetical protein
LALEDAKAQRQLQAVLFALVTLGYVDGSFDPRERRLVEETIGELVEGWLGRFAELGSLTPEALGSLRRSYRQQLFEVLGSIDQSLARLMATEVGVEDERERFISSRLMLGCFEALTFLSEKERQALLGFVDRLIAADGVVHSSELRFREALVSNLLRRPAPRTPPVERPFHFSVEREPLPIDAPFEPPLLAEVERPFPSGGRALRKAAEADIRLMLRAQKALLRLRDGSWGRLDSAPNVEALVGQEPFVDTLVHVFPPSERRRTDYIVVGDLHGCYGSLKAVLAQTDFFGRVARFRRDPAAHPDVKLILLGDYLDRGLWSFEGVLRLVLTLFVEFPEHVIPLVGNHEWLVEQGPAIRSSVMPADAVERWTPHLPKEYFQTAKTLFDQLGSVVLIDRIVVVHGGVPRQEVIERWHGLSGFNDAMVRFQMSWSDPVMLAEVSAEMQASTQRFAFGMDQFQSFMDALGARVMIRGHEKAPEGFKAEYDDGRYRLFTVFSAGGFNNRDLPEHLDYRRLHPSFLVLSEREGRFVANPVRIAWERFNDPSSNRYLEVLGT